MRGHARCDLSHPTNMWNRFRRDERGSFLIQTVILLPVMLLLIGLVLDGGWMYWQYRRTEVMANAAAQAASHAIDLNYFRATNQVKLDRGEAAAVASDFIQLNRRGQITFTGVRVGNDQITVNATARIPTIFFRFAGISSFTMQVQGTAYPAFGINREGQ